MDDGAIEIDNSEAYTLINLNVGPADRREEGESAVKKEFLQSHQKENFQPMAPDKLTSEQKKGAL
eukprot:9369232-Ditylum_brightwellii.AAC.1